MGLQGRPHRDRALSGHNEEQNAGSQEDRPEAHNYRLVGCLSSVVLWLWPRSIVKRTSLLLPSHSLIFSPLTLTKAKNDRRLAILRGLIGEEEEFEFDREKITNLACQDMLTFVKSRVDLESERPEDMMMKQWVLRHIMTMYLSIQYIRDAAVVLRDITGVFGLQPHPRYYDPFLNYYCVRGEEGRHTTAPSVCVTMAGVYRNRSRGANKYFADFPVIAA